MVTLKEAGFYAALFGMPAVATLAYLNRDKLDGVVEVVEEFTEPDTSPKPLEELLPQDYQEEVIDAEIPVVVQIYKKDSKCHKRLERKLEVAAGIHRDKVRFVKIDYGAKGAKKAVKDHDPLTPVEIPRTIFVKDGNIIWGSNDLSDVTTEDIPYLVRNVFSLEYQE